MQPAWWSEEVTRNALITIWFINLRQSLPQQPPKRRSKKNREKRRVICGILHSPETGFIDPALVDNVCWGFGLLSNYINLFRVLSSRVVTATALDWRHTRISAVRAYCFANQLIVSQSETREEKFIKWSPPTGPEEGLFIHSPPDWLPSITFHKRESLRKG